MDPRNRVVMGIPLAELWTDEGALRAMRGGPLDREAIRDRLNRGPVRFVVANVGRPLEWVPLGRRFEFWKRDVTVRLADADKTHLDEFSDGMAYHASEWTDSDDETPIVLLEVAH
jgi:hypothetical protein